MTTFCRERLNVLLDFGLSLQKACDGCGVGVSQRTPHRCRLTSAYLCEIACESVMWQGFLQRMTRFWSVWNDKRI